MNYRHGFHAGNFADVLKHAVLIACLDHLALKDKPFAVIDTHAGAGRYDLAGPEAQKTGEWRNGIGRLIDLAETPSLVQRYVAVILAAQPHDKTGLTVYPGSPILAQSALRRSDRLVALELHAATAEALETALPRSRQVQVLAEDGYTALRRLIPPLEKRGLVLIDPPFEEVDEFERLAGALKSAYERWPTGCYLAWYPVKDPGSAARFEAELISAALPRLLCAGLSVRTDSERLSGCRVVIINPPWTLHAALSEALPWMADVLAQGPGASHILRWLTPDL